jgi:hypothetical protein
MVKRTAIFLHRWIGVALCVLFLLWFPSGIGMMYWSFPTVTAADRLERSPALDPSKVVLSPSEAAARLGIDPTETRLNTFNGRPVYRFGADRRPRIVYADTGQEQTAVSRALMDRAAYAWTGQLTSDAVVEPVQAVDQWTVQLPAGSLRPLWKYSWSNGEQLYISGTSGEVVQYTTRASRIGAYLGPIPHWFYFTPLRKHQPQWSALVIWTSGIGTCSAILGVVIGLWMYSPSKRYRYGGAPTSIPYRGQKRWHTVLGLIFGLATATWAFSGMLSMDPFPSASDRQADARRGVAQALRGPAKVSTFAAKHPRAALEQLAGRQVKELELTSFGGEPIYMATLAGGSTALVPVTGSTLDEFDRERIIDAVKKASAGSTVETRSLDRYDRYYLDRERRLPLPVILALMNDPQHTRYYIDPKTARIVGSYSDRSWVSRWLYNGLHSLNFPWLYDYRPLWDIVVITFMLGGTALCVTSLVLAWRVVGRKLGRLFAERPRPDNTRLREDVA